MSGTNGATNLFGDLDVAPENETIMAHAERIDAMARTLIQEVGKFRARLESDTRSIAHLRAVDRLATEDDKRAARHHPIKACLTYFDTKHQTKFDGEAATINGPADAGAMKRLIGAHGEERVRELIDQFFEEEDEWLTRTGYTVLNFQKRVPGLISSSRTPARALGNTRNTAGNGRHSEAAASMIRSAYGHGR